MKIFSKGSFTNPFRKKPKFIYEISAGEYIPDTTCYDPYDLVQFIMDEDFRFKRDYLKGPVVITKVKNDIQGTVYFAKKIQLPKEEGFDWLAELSEFFTKKPLDYSMEDVIGENRSEGDITHNEAEEESKEAFTLEDFEFGLKQELEPDPIQASDVPGIDEPILQEIEKEPMVSEKVTGEEPLVQISKNEFLSLKKAIEEQNREIANLKEEKVQAQVQVIHSEPLMPESQHESILSAEIPNVLEKELEIDMDQLEFEANSDEIIQGVLQSTKSEINQALTKFIETETEKIKEEIKQLDKRALIEEIVTKRLEAEEKDKLNNLNQQLISEKERQVQEEKVRHQQALQRIEEVFLSQLQEETATVQEAYKDKIDQTIKDEYEKQTEQLSRILQGKMDELKMRQHTMNAGLEANFKEALVNFNREHMQVIQVVEQKKYSNPIDLVTRRKLKQA